MRLKFANTVSKEKQQYLRQALKEYEATMPMTEEERQDLYSWISEGNDIYSNPGNVASESGREMDFITGIRADAERFEVLSSMTQEELAEELGWNIPASDYRLISDWPTARVETSLLRGGSTRTPMVLYFWAP